MTAAPLVGIALLALGQLPSIVALGITASLLVALAVASVALEPSSTHDARVD